MSALRDTALAAKPSKHLRVKLKLRQQILDGVLAPGSKLPPDLELHKRFKVHRLTVIRALNDLVAEGLIVRRRGSGTYVAGQDRAPQLVHGRSLNLGIVWRSTVSPQWMLNSFLGLATLGALEAIGLNPAGAVWPLVRESDTSRAIWTDPAQGLRVECLGESSVSMVRHPPIEAVRAGEFDGVLAVGILDENFIEQLRALGIPVVLCDVLMERFNGKIDQVYVDPQQGYQDAVRQFTAAGLTRIHFVGAQLSLPAPSAQMSFDDVKKFRGQRVKVDPDSFLRFSAYRQAMDQCGLDVPETFVHRMSSKSESVDALAQRLVALPKAERPQAVVCHEHSQAVALIEAFARAGLKLQGAGASSAEGAHTARPIRADMKALGATAVDLLVSRIQRPLRPFLRVGIPMVFDLDGDMGNVGGDVGGVGGKKHEVHSQQSAAARGVPGAHRV